MEHLDKNIFDDSSFGINNQSKEILKTIVFWSKFISIVGLLAIIIISVGSVFLVLNRQIVLMIALRFLGVFSLCVIPLVYLFVFARKTEQFLRESDTIILQKAIQNLKSYFKSIGVSMILMITIYLLALLTALIYEF